MTYYKVTLTQLVEIDVWVEADSEEEMRAKALEEADTYLSCYRGNTDTITITDWEASDGE